MLWEFSISTAAAAVICLSYSVKALKQRNADLWSGTWSFKYWVSNTSVFLSRYYMLILLSPRFLIMVLRFVVFSEAS